ncbi:hypothetical protein ACIQFU_09130 [Streptomyces sp. NPDC093065]|uniref:hypothetical protein n=1 Tax=Streptomyces sp. NPDC093065 TaxID=3366021 RepID=UPI0037FA7646
MSGGRRPHPPVGDAAAIATQAEGFLRAQAYYDEARGEARTLCDRMPWMTSAQAEDFTRHYVDHRLTLTRAMLSTTVTRAGELREDYEGRYLQLRRALLRRHAGWVSVVLAAAAGLHTMAWVWLR